MFRFIFESEKKEVKKSKLRYYLAVIQHNHSNKYRRNIEKVHF